MDDSIAATESVVQAKELGADLLTELKQAVQGTAEKPAEPSHMSDADYKELFRLIDEAKAVTQTEIDGIIEEFMDQRKELAEEARRKKIDEIKQKIAA